MSSSLPYLLYDFTLVITVVAILSGTFFWLKKNYFHKVFKRTANTRNTFTQGRQEPTLQVSYSNEVPNSITPNLITPQFENEIPQNAQSMTQEPVTMDELSMYTKSHTSSDMMQDPMRHHATAETVSPNTYEANVIEQELDNSTNNSGYSSKPVTQDEFGLIVLHLFAPRSKKFSGRQLFHLFSGYKLKYGSNGIFHMLDMKGEPLFSIASAVEPGIFDISNPDDFITPGVTAFIELNRVANPQKSFTQMLSTIDGMSRDLGADLLDGEYRRLTRGCISEYVARIKGLMAHRNAV
ncbi:MAG: hypothetical protein COB50_00065 [Thiotrichales bacterium]|nr:MAG: hypothetical protein COB50_00065 [Thiotrichales bacterium]